MRASIASGSNPEAPKPPTATPARASLPTARTATVRSFALVSLASISASASSERRVHTASRSASGAVEASASASAVAARNASVAGDAACLMFLLPDVRQRSRALKYSDARESMPGGAANARAWSATMRSAARVTSERWPPPGSARASSVASAILRRASSSSGDALGVSFSRAARAASPLFFALSRLSAASAEPTASNASATSVAEVEAPPPVAVARLTRRSHLGSGAGFEPILTIVFVVPALRLGFRREASS